jgi:hypothetical protein
LRAQADADFTYSYGTDADEFAFLRTASAPDGEPLAVAPGVAAAAAEAAAWSRTATSQAGKARVWPEHPPTAGGRLVSPTQLAAPRRRLQPNVLMWCCSVCVCHVPWRHRMPGHSSCLQQKPANTQTPTAWCQVYSSARLVRSPSSPRALQGYQGMVPNGTVPNGSPAQRTVSEDPAQFGGSNSVSLAEQKVRQLDVGVFRCDVQAGQ